MSGLYFGDNKDEAKFGEMLPIEQGDLPSSMLRQAAWERGQSFTITNSARRGLKQLNEELFGSSKMLDPKAANEQYGVPGALSFSSPIRESVAKVLRERKDEEIARSFILDKAKGLQNLGVFGTELVSGILDPVGIVAGFIPIVREATYAQWTGRFGLTAGRFAAGFVEGAAGNALLEPIVFGQAYREQAEYGPWDSLANIAAGGILGGGLHVVGGRIMDWMAGVEMKKHLKALQTAINQTGNGEKVQVEPIIHTGDEGPPPVEIDFDEGTTQHVVMGDVADPLKNKEWTTAAIENKYDQWLVFTMEDGTEWIGQPLEAPDNGYLPLKIFGDNNVVSIPYGKIKNIAYGQTNLDNALKKAGYDEDVSADDLLMATDDSPEQAGAVSSLINYVSSKSSGRSLIEGYSVKQDPINGTFYVTDPFGGMHEGFADTQSAFNFISNNKAAIALKNAKAAPLVGDSTDGIELFAEGRMIEGLNIENMIDEGTGQLGSNKGGVYTDKATGKKYYVKLPVPEKIEQTRQEFIAYSFYKMAGQDMPEMRPVLEDGHFVGVASEWQEHATSLGMSDYTKLYKLLGDYRQNDPDGFARFMRGVIMHMWLGNWDWASPNNVMFTSDGRPFWIDFGATLQHRATGIKKDPAFSENVVELKWIFTPQESPHHAKHHFERMQRFIDEIGDDDLWKQGVNDLSMLSDEDITSTVYKMTNNAEDASELSGILIARRVAILEKYHASLDPTLLKSAEFFTYDQAQEFVKKMAPEWKPLSQAASSKLSDYKGSGYVSVNQYLRGKVKGLSQQAVKNLKATIKALDEAMQGFAFPQEAYIWRGGVPKDFLSPFGVKAGDSTEVIRKKILGAGIGQTIIDKGFASTTTSKSFATGWGHDPTGKVVFRIKVAKGQKAAVPLGNMLHKGHGHVDGEMEFVLPRDTRYTITDVFLDKASGMTVINAVIKPTPVKPMSPKMAIKMAEKHVDDFSAAADDALMDPELTYSLKESMKIPESDELVTEINKLTSETLQDVKKSATEAEKESLDKIVEQITLDHDTMVEQSNAMAKGAMAAYGCVLKNA